MGADSHRQLSPLFVVLVVIAFVVIVPADFVVLSTAFPWRQLFNLGAKPTVTYATLLPAQFLIYTYIIFI